MILPYRFKLENTAYGVTPTKQLGAATGWLYPAIGRIHIAVTNDGKKRTPQQIQTTFWHEATHAILHDMESPLWRSEKFVTEFSTRLVKLINTAEFK